jgi:hypothetical protein
VKRQKNNNIETDHPNGPSVTHYDPEKNHQVHPTRGKHDIRSCAEIYRTFDERPLSMCLKPVRSPGLHSETFVRWNLGDLEKLETLNGRVLNIELVNSRIRINGSRLLFKDHESRNGVIHYIYPAFFPDDWEQNQSKVIKGGYK